MARLVDSAKIYRMESPYTQEQLEKASSTRPANGFKACYIRPLMYRGYAALGVNPLPCPVDVAIMVWEWGAYLGADALEKGVDVWVSSWKRMAPNTFPSLSKTAPTTPTPRSSSMEAVTTATARASRSTVRVRQRRQRREHLRRARRRHLHAAAERVDLPGITRDTVMQLAQDLGFRCARR